MDESSNFDSVGNMTSLPCKHWRECGVQGGGCCNIGVQEKPSIGWCLTRCDKYDGPDRGRIGRDYMWSEARLLPSHQLVRHAHVLVANGRPTTAYLGDRIGTLIGQLTHRKPCVGCKKVEAGLNLVDKWGRKLVAHAH